MKCPKCHFENPSDSKFCNECGTQLLAAEEVSVTKTLETTTEELTRGTTFARRYEIIEELGKGGMGKVYRVYDKKIEGEIALKLIKPEIAADKKTIERFRNELKLAREISHRNVCRMYDLGEEEGIHYITMEYVAGEDLKSFIRRAGPLGTGKAAFIAKQVCEGLAEAHRLGVVHRDLKPSNIMIDKEGNARIMDFGIARSIKGKGITGAGVMIGTPEYMSPEQVEGKETDQRSDIYSLGIILYEMVTGRVPFEGDTPFTIGVKHKSETPKNPKDINAQIPEDLNCVILKCLEKDKGNRYQSASELRSELENIEKGIPTTEKVTPKRKPITSKEITVTFGLKKLLFPASVVIGLIIVVVIILQLLSKKETVLAPKIENSIAVVSFENQTGDKAYDYLQKAIPNLLITNLEQTGYLYVATWERMHDLLKQIGKKDVEIIDRDLGFELCLREGIEAIVIGSFIKAENIFATDVKVLDVETKRLLKSASSRGEGVDSILVTQIDELSREIFQGIGIARQREKAAQLQIADVTTTSMEAYNYFLGGKDNYEKFYWERARQFLEKAIELDSTFAMAYFYLGGVYERIGDSKARNDAYVKAKTYSGKTTEKERLYIEAAYANTIEGNQEKSFRTLKQIAQKYPKEKQIHYQLGRYYYLAGFFHEAIEEYNKALELDPNWGYAINACAWAYADMDNFDKAVAYLKRYVIVSPDDANPLDSMAEIYFRMGRLDDAITKYKEALEVKPDFQHSIWSIGYIYALKENYVEAMKWPDKFIDRAQSPGRRAEGYVWKGFYHYWLASLDKSLSDLSKAENVAEAAGNMLWKAYADWMKGWIYYDRGELELSRRYFKSWFDIYCIEMSPFFIPMYKAEYSFYLGLVDLRQGRINSAKSKQAEMMSHLSEIPTSSKYWLPLIKGSYDILLGEILLAEDSFEKAIVICEKASPLGMPPPDDNSRYRLDYNVPFLKDVLARAYQHNGELDKAIAEYERLITFNPNSKERYLIHPKYYYRLAKLYEQKGLEGKAIEHYEKFLDL